MRKFGTTLIDMEAILCMEDDTGNACLSVYSTACPEKMSTLTFIVMLNYFITIMAKSYFHLYAVTI